MITTAIKGVFAHKMRLALTALAIILGVALVSGTYVFTDTINARFDTLFTDVYAGVDATVRAEQADFGASDGSLPESTLETVRAVDGVDTAVASVGGVAQIIGPDGEPIGGQGPPTIGFSWVDEPQLTALRIEDGNGRAPLNDGEVVIDVATATANELVIGGEIGIQVSAGVERFEIVGLANFGTEDNLAGATLSIFEFDEAQRLFELDGQISTIDVLATEEIDTDALVASISAALPEGTEVVTGEQQTQEQLAEVTEGLGFLNTALLAFAAVAVFVGAFIIQNTFRIIVAQRTRELALMRAIGATGRQVTAMVVIEALIVATLASAAGIVAGIGVSALLKSAMDAAGLGIPDGPLTIEPRTIVVGMAVGLVVTMVAAVLPARRAARVPPVAAMSEVSGGVSRRSLRGRALAGAGLTGVALAALGTGLAMQNGAALWLVSLGALGAFLGISVLAPLFATVIARVLGRPLPGITGTLARENTVRQPRRTASTASALMIGVALVAFVSIFAASIKASVSDTLESAFPADLAFQSENFSTGVSPQLSEDLGELTEVETVSAIQAGVVRIGGEDLNVAAVEGSTVERVYSPEASVALAEFDDGLLVQSSVLEDRSWAVGDVVGVEYGATTVVDTEIVGTFEDASFANYLISADTYSANFESEDAVIVFVRLAEGVTVAEGATAAETVLGAFPAIDMNTKSDQIADAEAAVDQLVALFSGLLGLAVVIAVLGIANTLALSIVERTREIGLLRAVGMVKRQVRRMVRWESMIIALFGGLLGVAVGTGLGWAVVTSLAEDGLGSFALPAGQLALWLVLSALAGVIAAVLPARKASNLDVLEAISYQ